MTCNRMRALSLAAMFLVTALLASAAKAEAPDPAVQQVQTFYNVLLDSMKHAKELRMKGRYEKLKPVTEQSFDFPDMVRFVVGSSNWATMPAADQQALLVAFERMTIANYASNFSSYDGEKFVVDPVATARGTDRVVQSKLVTKDQTVPFGYRMRQTGGSWKIVDIYLNGYISQLAVQRSDFALTLAAGGASGLVKKLNALTDKLMAD